jgi:hypothetical protein
MPDRFLFVGVHFNRTHPDKTFSGKQPFSTAPTTSSVGITRHEFAFSPTLMFFRLSATFA